MAREMVFNWLRPGSLGAFGGALRRAREGKGMTLEGLAGVTGISKPYLSNIETGRSPGPASEEKLRRIAGALGLEEGEVLGGADWLRAPESIRRVLAGMGEEGDTLKRELRAGGARRRDGAIDLDVLMGGGKRETRNAEHETRNAEHETRNAERGTLKRGTRKMAEGEMGLRAVPLINRVAAGQAAEFTDLSYPAGVADAYVGAPDVPEMAAAFAVRVMGESMMPEYKEGEILIVGPAEERGGARDGEDCVVRLGEADNFATTFKRVYFERDGAGEVVGVRLVALNRAYGERRVGAEEVTGIYPVMYRLVPAGVGGERRDAAALKGGEEAGEAVVKSFTTERASMESD